MFKRPAECLKRSAVCLISELKHSCPFQPQYTNKEEIIDTDKYFILSKIFLNSNLQFLNIVLLYVTLKQRSKSENKVKQHTFKTHIYVYIEIF